LVGASCSFSAMKVILSMIVLFIASAGAPQHIDADTQTRAVPNCGATQKDHKLVGWGKYGVFYSVPKRGMKIGGKPDVDYLRLVIKPDSRNVFLVLWFGSHAFNPEPRKEILQASTGVTKLELTDSGGMELGVDMRGQKQDGTLWRHFGVFASGLEGAEYENLSPADAAVFDQIIESACVVPYPGERANPQAQGR
jgi:hypothetical protein